ncbi:bL21 family ribosomal protein, partial [Escherichia coli]|uniref:bL21 family ribosomal protein n=1 Tax=Escherichia coli TaxID=562 RepID=UPI000A7DA5B3
MYAVFQSGGKQHRVSEGQTVRLEKLDPNDAIRAAHEGVIGQILTMNLLRIQAFWSHYRF